MEGSLDRRDADVRRGNGRDVAHARAEGHPRGRALRQRALRPSSIPRRPGRLPGSQARRRAHRREARERHQLAGSARLDIQPLSGDVVRAAVPEGTVPSSNTALAGWGDTSQWSFTTAAPPTPALCTGTTYRDQLGSAALPDRIKDGWYQLPGDTNYYGADRLTIGVAVALGAAWIDNACGPIGKAVYDAAHIADPEIDYSDYDTDKDGIVDFFMMVFTGIGGNGASRACRLRQHLAALGQPRVLLHRPRHRPHRLHLRRPAAGPLRAPDVLHEREPT